MTDLDQRVHPAAEVRSALLVDAQQFLERDRGLPPTIGDIAKNDGLHSSMAQRLIDAVESEACQHALDAPIPA